METLSTLPGLLEAHVAKHPDRIAVIQGEALISYGELDALGRQAAAWLRVQGIRPGDRVAVWLTNRVGWLVLLFGLARVGAALVAVNTRYRASEIEYLLTHSGARMLVLQAGFRNVG